MLVLQPDVGFRAPLPWMALFWALQISVGLTVLQLVSRTLTRAFGAGRLPIWLLVIGSGVLGSVLLAPLYWLIGEGMMQRLLGFYDRGDDDGTGDTAWGGSLLAEYLDIVGPVTAAWALISLPRLDGLVPPMLGPTDRVAMPVADVAPQPSERAEPPVREAPSVTVLADTPAWRRRLPPALGDDLIAVASELQYLRVWTARGCALVQGALQEVEEGEGDRGMRVHRSWWVDARHVLQVRSTADRTVCELSDGRVVPVSRRRKAQVIARFGDAARYRPPGQDQSGSPAAGA